jgi:hypothetical protein
LVARLPEVLSFASEEVEPEIWCKWSSQTLPFPKESSLPLEKKRWLRKFDTCKCVPVEILLDEQERPFAKTALPKRGCNVEWTVITTPKGETVSTLGFESFGSLDDIECSLRSVVAAMAERKPPQSSGAFRGGYPAWIARFGRA